ncbi:MAG: hypothetical protein ACPL5F_00725 [Moorellaceae bacterium]
MTARYIDITAIRQAVDRCCKTIEECGTCNKAQCLIGFIQTVLDYAQAKNTYRIPHGPKFIPEDDLRFYYQNDLLEAISEVLIQCQSCQDNHEEDCVINISRKALEQALFGDYMEFTGSIAAYLLQIGQLNPEVGQKLIALYQAKKKEATL